MNKNKTTVATVAGATGGKVELDQKGKDLVKQAVETLTTGKKELSPGDRLELLRRREKAIAESSEILKGLIKLRESLDELRSWGFGSDGRKSVLTISGDEDFTTTNTVLISALKEHLIVLIENQIETFETNLSAAQFN